MSLSVASHVNLDTIKNLDASKTYFLSSTTGEVKEASFWMRFKCAIGVQSARQKVANLVDAVRTTLLDSAGKMTDDTLATALQTIDRRFMVKGSDITNIVGRFTVANNEKIVKASAEKCAADAAGIAATKTAYDMYNFGYGLGNTDAITSIVKHALKPIISGELPISEDNGRKVLDDIQLKSTLADAAEKIRAEILDIMKSGKLGAEKIDKLYAKHIIDTLYNADGTRNDKTIADLKTPLQVKLDAAFRAEKGVLSKLTEQGVNPEQRLSDILGCCGDDDELKEFLIDHGLVPGLCIGGDNKPRKLAKIQEKIDGLKENLQEIRDIQIAFPGSASVLKHGLAELTGSTFPKGMLRDMAALVGGVKFTRAPRMHALMKVENLFAGMLDFSKAESDVMKKLNVRERFAQAGDAGGGGPQTQFVRTCAVGLLLSKLGPGFVSRLPNIFQGKQFQTMQSYLDQTKAQLKFDSGYADLPPGTSQALEELDLVIPTIHSIVNIDREKPMPELNTFEFEDASLDDPSYGYMLGELDSAMKVQ